MLYIDLCTIYTLLQVEYKEKKPGNDSRRWIGGIVAVLFKTCLPVSDTLNFQVFWWRYKQSAGVVQVRYR